MKSYEQFYGKLKLSPTMKDRIRLMYAIDMATRPNSNRNGDTGELLFSGKLSTEWLKTKDIMQNPEFSDSMLASLKKEGDTWSWGAFNIRRGKKTLIVSARVARVPLNAVSRRKRKFEYDLKKNYQKKVWDVPA